MTGTGKIIPDEDEKEIGLPARRFLQASPTNFVLVIDDVEHDRRPFIDGVFERYRLALDTMLVTPQMQQRAAVHFLANMLEAYYFADHAAVNSAAGGQVLLQDHPQDVEMIPHPKNELKHLWRTFDEVEHGLEIVQRLDVNHVLAHPEECCWLRAIFAWCIAKLVAVGVVYDPAISNAFCLPAGCREPLTANQ